MSRCSYECFARTHGHQIERCPYEREGGMPYCWEHLHRVAWLSLVSRWTVPRWIWWVVGFCLCSALLTGSGAMNGEHDDDGEEQTEREAEKGRRSRVSAVTWTNDMSEPDLDDFKPECLVLITVEQLDELLRQAYWSVQE